MDVGSRLRELREAKGHSQADIEKRTRLLRCYISRVECGHTIPELRTLKKWAKALELELYQLFYQGKRRPVHPRLAKPARPDTREGVLLSLFQQMPEEDQKLLVSLAREAVRTRGKRGRLERTS